MRIALVSTPFVAVPPADYGGTELVIHELAEGLTAAGHEVVLFATGDSRSSARLEWLLPRPSWPPDSLMALNHCSWALSRIAQGSFDVVHAHSAEALALTRLVPDIPFVYTLHHERDESCSAYYPFFPDVFYTAISERQRQLEVVLPHIRTIHHGLHAPRYAGETRAGDHVCFIGRLSQPKGPHVAIDVAERAGVPIVVAGAIHAEDQPPGFAAREIEPRLRQPHVRYVGKIGMRRKTALLRSARALVMPLLWEEPFGLIMIEAMLCGCPVVAFPRGSAPELIDEGLTGFLVPDADAMVDVLRNGLRGFDREACRARAVERFGRERMVADYVSWYREATRARAGTPSSSRLDAAA
ncbi:MAG TPA: glycosyltransferase family 4 protein [Longimicrobiales bacterium]